MCQNQFTSTGTYCVVLSSTGEVQYEVGDMDINEHISLDLVHSCHFCIILLMLGATKQTNATKCSNNIY